MAADGEWEALPPPTGGGTWAQPGALTTDKRGYVYWSAKDYGGTGGFAIFQAIDGVTDRRAREAHNEADEDESDRANELVQLRHGPTDR